MPRGMFYEDFVVGATYTTGSRTITADDIRTFADLSGDRNPLHTDEQWVRANTEFTGLIAHGALGLAIATGLSAELGHMEGTALAFLAVEQWRFLKPIMVGDVISARVAIEGKRETSQPTAGVVKRSVKLVNQRGETVQEGLTVALVRRSPKPV